MYLTNFYKSNLSREEKKWKNKRKFVLFFRGFSFIDVIPRSFNFRVKHYPGKPLKELKQEKSRLYKYYAKPYKWFKIWGQFLRFPSFFFVKIRNNFDISFILITYAHNLGRYFLYLQLRRDLHSGRLVGLNNDMHVLAAHILQGILPFVFFSKYFAIFMGMKW